MKIKDVVIHKHIMSFWLGSNRVPNIGDYLTIELEDGDTLDIVVNELIYIGDDIKVYFSYDRREEESHELSNGWELDNRNDMFECGVDFDY